MRVKWLISGAIAVIFAAGVAVGAWQQQTTGTRREPQFENANVRVWKSIIMPNQPLSLHRHDFGRTIVVLKGGTLDVVDAAGKTLQQYKWETGKAYWLDVDPPNQQHGDLNRTKEPIEVIVVEMRK
jgi:quercetin dioxygenase-like cupin family protein